MEVFRLAYIDSTILMYASILIVIGLGIIVFCKRFFTKPSLILVTRGFAVVFLIAVLYPLCMPLWTSIEIDESTLKVRGPLFETSVAITDLRLDDARTFSTLPDSLTVMHSSLTTRRGSGIRFSKLRLGTFLLENGRAGMLYITSQENFVVLPARDRRVFIFTIRDPERFMNFIRERTRPAQH